MRDIVGVALCREKATIVNEIGDIKKLNSLKLADGKGGKYIFTGELKGSFIIPGMKQTVSKNNLTRELMVCDDMVPQGICCHGGYVFITAYCMSKLNSAVIYVLDVNSGEYITTLIMHKHLHAGGIVCVEGHLWVADTGVGDTGYLFYFDYSQISEAIKVAREDKSVTAIDLSGFDRGVVCLGAGHKASFVTVYKGDICVGEYMKNEDNVGRLSIYRPSELLEGRVSGTKLTTIPANANGVLFYEVDNKIYMLITANRGKKLNSLVHIFEMKEADHKYIFTEIKTIEMPCMVEEAFSYGLYTYFVFESCAKPYRTAGVGKMPAKHIVGRVCGFYTKFIFE